MKVLQNLNLLFYFLFLHWLENFYNHSLIVGDVNGFEYFTILSPTKFLNQLVVIILITPART